MSIPATSPLNLGVLEALDRLGIKGALIPALERGVAAVVVMADLSRTIASELLEARRVATVTGFADPGNHNHCLVYSRAPGGIVVEEIVLILGSGLTPPICAFKLIQNQAVIGTVVNAHDIGGVPGVSFARFDSRAPPLAVPTDGALLVLNTLGGGTRWSQFEGRIFVPAGVALVLAHDQTNQPMDVQITWRELADIQGAP